MLKKCRRPFVVLRVACLIALVDCASDNAGNRGGSGGSSPGGSSGSGGRSASGGTSAGGVVGGTGGRTTGAGGAGGPTSGGGGRGGSSGIAGAAGNRAVTCDNLPFCDDFQAGVPGQAPGSPKWMVDLNGSGTVTIDGGLGRDSTQSLRVSANNGFHTMAMVRGAPLFPLPAGVLYGRAYVRLGAVLTNNHVVWIEAGSVMNDVNETRIGANLGLLDVNLWPGDEDHRATGVTLTPGGWTCIEFMFDNVTRETRVWLNGTELPDLHVTNWSVPSYDAVRFGWELNGGTSEIWYDDIALGYGRIGCL